MSAEVKAINVYKTTINCCQNVLFSTLDAFNNSFTYIMITPVNDLFRLHSFSILWYIYYQFWLGEIQNSLLKHYQTLMTTDKFTDETKISIVDRIIDVIII